MNWLFPRSIRRSNVTSTPYLRTRIAKSGQPGLESCLAELTSYRYRDTSKLNNSRTEEMNHFHFTMYGKKKVYYISVFRTQNVHTHTRLIIYRSLYTHTHLREHGTDSTQGDHWSNDPRQCPKSHTLCHFPRG